MHVHVNGPDGRLWRVGHRADPPSPFALLRPGARWVVEATTDDERRVWQAASRRGVRGLVAEVALALRTGGAGPPGEVDPPPLGPAVADGEDAPAG